jgi:glycosyltransferase involved in cell wall biosynthesis
MINLIFLIRSLDYGGAERQLVNLVKGLNREEFNPTVLTFYSGPLEKELEEAGICTILLEKKGRWEIFGFLYRLYRKLKVLKPDVIHGYLSMPSILTIMFKPIFPRARMVFGVRASNTDLSRYDWLARFVGSLECFLSRFADLVIVNSKAGFKHCLGQGFPQKKMIVIPNGIDTERFKPDKKAGLKVRKEWEVREGEILIGLVGRLDPKKDHTTFLKAASILNKVKKNVRFVCVGKGSEPYKNSLIKIERSLDLSQPIIWVSPRSDMPSVFNAFDIVCSSSSFGEGFPNVIGEAMACQIPCVVTDVGDSSWLVGETGIVVPPNDPHALAAGWNQYLTKDNWEMAGKAQLRITENFTLKQLAERTESALTNCFFNGYYGN